MQKIITYLWFDNNAEEAVNFYTSIFKNSKILKKAYYGEAGAEVSGKKKNSVMTIEFEIEGQQFTALNGGPYFKFTPAISFLVNCKSQDEVDELWGKLSSDPKAEQCGWLIDKFGVSWQIIPTLLGELLRDKDPKKTEKVMKAMLQMKKIDIAALKKAYEEEN